MAFPLPDKPSIAVLPFEYIGGDPEHEYLADGMTEDIITSLSKLPNLFVIARNSVFTYKGKPVKVKQVSEELGVRYVLEGSVQKAGNRVRITTQLVDATMGHHLWAERYDRELKDLFALQDEIALEIVTALQMKLTGGDQARLLYKGTKNLEARRLVIQGYNFYMRNTKEDVAQARQMWERAVELDPQYAWAWTHLAWTHMEDILNGWSESPAESFKRAVEISQKALAIDDTLPDVHGLLGVIHLSQRQHEQAIAAGKRAVELAPNHPDNLVLLGWYMGSAGSHEEGVALVKKAMRLHPYYSDVYLLFLGFNYFFTRQYKETIEAFEELRNRRQDLGGPWLNWAFLYLTASYSELGQEEEARAHAKEVLRLNPRFSLEAFRKRPLLKDPADLELFLGALRRAGLPEGG